MKDRCYSHTQQEVAKLPAELEALCGSVSTETSSRGLSTQNDEGRKATMLQNSNCYEAHAHHSVRSNDAVQMPLTGLSTFEKPAFWTIQRIGTSGVIP